MGDDLETLKTAATEFGEQHKINHVALVVRGEFQNRQRMKMSIHPNAEVTVVIYELRPDGVVKANHALGPGSLTPQAIQAIIDDMERFKR